MPVSRVLCLLAKVITIYLGRQLPAASSDLTRERNGPFHCSSIRSCSGWGLPSQPVAWLLVSSYLAFPPLPVPLIRPSAVCLCGTFLEVASTGGYPASCPAELGLSSDKAFRHQYPRLSGILMCINYLFFRGIIIYHIIAEDAIQNNWKIF